MSDSCEPGCHRSRFDHATQYLGHGTELFLRSDNDNLSGRDDTIMHMSSVRGYSMTETLKQIFHRRAAPFSESWVSTGVPSRLEDHTARVLMQQLR